MRINTREELEARRAEYAASLKTQRKQILICAGTGCVAGGSLNIFAKIVMLKLKFSFMVHYVFVIQVNVYFLVWLVDVLLIEVNVQDLAGFLMNFYVQIALLIKYLLLVKAIY